MPPRPSKLARLNLVPATAEAASPAPAPPAAPSRPGDAPATDLGGEAGRRARRGGEDPRRPAPGRQAWAWSPLAACSFLASSFFALASGLLARLTAGTPFDGSASARSRSMPPGSVDEGEKPP